MGTQPIAWEFGRRGEARPGTRARASERLAQTVLGVGRCRRGVEGADDLPRGRTAACGRCGGSSRRAVQISQGFDPNRGFAPEMDGRRPDEVQLGHGGEPGLGKKRAEEGLQVSSYRLVS